MNHQHVIARAYKGQPLHRVIICARDGLIFIANISSADRAENGEIPAVGFPETDVFVFDPMIYETLQEEWEMTHHTEPATWGGLAEVNILASRG